MQDEGQQKSRRGGEICAEPTLGCVAKPVAAFLKFLLLCPICRAENSMHIG